MEYSSAPTRGRAPRSSRPLDPLRTRSADQSQSTPGRRDREGQVHAGQEPGHALIAFGRKVYVAGDPKGEWSVVSRAVGGQTIELGGAVITRLSPLDEGPRVTGIDDETWRVETAKRRRDYWAR